MDVPKYPFCKLLSRDLHCIQGPNYVSLIGNQVLIQLKCMSPFFAILIGRGVGTGGNYAYGLITDMHSIPYPLFCSPKYTLTVQLQTAVGELRVVTLRHQGKSHFYRVI